MGFSSPMYFTAVSLSNTALESDGNSLEKSLPCTIFKFRLLAYSGDTSVHAKSSWKPSGLPSQTNPLRLDQIFVVGALEVDISTTAPDAMNSSRINSNFP